MYQVSHLYKSAVFSIDVWYSLINALVFICESISFLVVQIQTLRIYWIVVSFLFKVSCKARNHPQIIQTIHKTSKPPTNQPNYPQTIQKPAKYQTNHPLISQKLQCFFPEDIFYEPQYFPCPSCEGREKWVHFLIFLLDFAFRLLHCTIL